MAISLFCNNSPDGKKKCGNIEPFIDPKTEKVYCPNCDQEILNVSFFTKSSLKSLKQYRTKQTVAFGVKCQSCNKEAKPIIVNDDIVCPHCKSAHNHLTPTFKLMLKAQLKTANKDI